MQSASLVIEEPFRLELIRIPEGFCVVGFDWSKSPITGLWDLDVRRKLSTLPQRRIVMPEYLIGKYSVTNAQFRVFLKATGYKTTSPSGAPVLWDPITLSLGGADKDNSPVVGVSYADAAVFCDWLAQATRLPLTLPSDLQWEKAARGEDARPYPWGWTSPDPERCTFLKRSPWDITPVAAHPAGASPYGVIDMIGNCHEMCFSRSGVYDDIWDSGYGGRTATYRGGCYADGPDRLLTFARVLGASYEWGQSPWVDPSIGFRIATAVAEEPRIDVAA